MTMIKIMMIMIMIMLMTTTIFKKWLRTKIQDYILYSAKQNEQVEIQVRPCKTIFCKAKLKVGELKFAPMSTNIHFAFRDVKVPDSAVMLNELQVQPGEFRVPYIMPKVLLDEGKAQPFVVPYWLVKTSDDKSACNMELQMQKVNGSSSFGNNGCKMLVEIPMLTNSVALGVGAELVFYKAPSKNPAKRGVPEPSAKPPLAKRARKAKAK